MPAKIRKSAAKLKVEAEIAAASASGEKTLRELSQYVQFTPDLKDKFLDELREIPNVTRACRRLSLTRRLVYNHRNDDPDFKQAWDEALEEGIEHLEEVAQERAVDKSDILLMFMLKGAKPETYRERFDHTSGGAPIATNPITVVEVHLAAEPVEESGETS